MYRLESIYIVCVSSPTLAFKSRLKYVVILSRDQKKEMIVYLTPRKISPVQWTLSTKEKGGRSLCVIFSHPWQRGRVWERKD